jgi:hypothetical protein
MASTYVNDLRLNEMATGDASGSWGTVTNTNLELIGEAFSYGTETIGDADSTLTIADGAADAARSFYLKITSSVDLTTTRIVTLGPNTVSKVWMIENATTGSQVITIKQGSGATINVPNGQVKMISTDGAGSGGAVLDLLVDVDLTGTTTLVNLDVSGTALVTGVLTTTAATVFNGGFTANADSTLGTDKKVQFRDAAIYINSSVDGQLDIVADTEIQIAATTVDLNGALDVSGTALVTGVLTTTAATVSNGGGQFNGAINVGVDDTGYDVKFFGATAGAYMLWDESADDLILGGAAGLSVNSTALVTGVLTTTAATVFNGGFAAGGVGTFADGSNSAPSLTNTGDLNTGLYFPAADEVGLTVGGTQRLNVSATGIDVTGTVVADGQITSARGATTGTYGFRHEGAGKYFRMGVPNASFAYFETDSTGGFSFEGNTIFRGAGTFNEPGNDLDFRVESDTNTHALFVQGSDGFVGIGTSSPYRLLSLYATQPVFQITNVASGNNQGTIQYQVAGSTQFNIDNQGSGSGGVITFMQAGTERMRIDSSGGLITNPSAGGHAVFNEGGVDADFRVESDANANALIVDASGSGSIAFGGTDVFSYGQTSGNGVMGYIIDNGSVYGSLTLSNNADRGWSPIYINKFAYTSGDDKRLIQWGVNGGALCNIELNDAGTAVVYQTTSDRRLKENIQDLTGGIETVKKLRPRSFEWVTSEDNTFPSQGFIADEADGIIPEIVSGEANAVYEDGKPSYQSMEYSKLVPILTAALKESITKIEDLEARITALENA